jgi:hypothetical protein
MSRVHTLQRPLEAGVIAAPKQYSLYINAGEGKPFYWLQSSARTEALSTSKATIRRWIGEMSVPEAVIYSKDAKLYIKEGDTIVQTSLYTGQKLTWKSL